MFPLVHVVFHWAFLPFILMSTLLNSSSVYSYRSIISLTWNFWYILYCLDGFFQQFGHGRMMAVMMWEVNLIERHCEVSSERTNNGKLLKEEQLTEMWVCLCDNSFDYVNNSMSNFTSWLKRFCTWGADSSDKILV